MQSDEELKERATNSLKRVAEIARGTTKTALLSLGALALIWFSQIRPQYKRLAGEVYPKLAKSYSLSSNKTRKLELIRAGASAREGSTVAEQEFLESKQIKDLGKGIEAEGKEQSRLIEKVTFEIFGLKIPVPTLYASTVWTILLLALIVYLAQARYAIWQLCSGALLSLKKLQKTPWSSLDGIAGSGPLWLAPAPSRPRDDHDVTTDELRAAFGWNRLETLPSIAATMGFLLLGVLELDVTAQGSSVIRTAYDFTNALVSLDLNRQLTTDPKLADLTIGQIEASLLCLIPAIVLIGTLILVVWWFRPWKVPGPLSTSPSFPKRMAALVLFAAGVVLVLAVIAALLPNLVFLVSSKFVSILPPLMWALAVSVVALCSLQLFAVSIGHRGAQRGAPISEKSSAASGDQQGESGPSKQEVDSPGKREITGIGPPMWSRRHLIAGGLSGLAGLCALIFAGRVYRLRKDVRDAARSRPRFRHKVRKWHSPDKLPQAEGFYVKVSNSGTANKAVSTPAPSTTPLPASKTPSVMPGLQQRTPRRLGTRKKATIIVYVNKDRKIPFATPLRNRSLRPASAAEIGLQSPSTHVNFSRASAVFELAAMEQIKKKDFDRACQLLIDGISHDLAYKKKIRGAPSLRLYDLLAKLVVRGSQEKHRARLLELGREAKDLISQQEIEPPAERRRRLKNQKHAVPMVKFEELRKKRKESIEARLKAWEPHSEWHSRVADAATELSWSATVAPYTSRGKNSKDEVVLSRTQTRS